MKKQISQNHNGDHQSIMQKEHFRGSFDKTLVIVPIVLVILLSLCFF